MKTKTTKVHLWAASHMSPGDFCVSLISGMESQGWILVDAKEITFDIPARDFDEEIKHIRQTKEKAALLAKIAEIDAL